MGMSASQARLLTITARMHDVEYQAQSIQNAKIQLATQEDDVYKEYIEALDQTTFTVKDYEGQRMVANFNTLCEIDAVRGSKAERYVLRDEHNNILVSDYIFNAYNQFKQVGGNAYEFALYMMDGQPENFDVQKYRDKQNSVFAENSAANKFGDYFDSINTAITEKLYELLELFPEQSRGSDSNGERYWVDNNEKQTKENIKRDLVNAMISIAGLNTDSYGTNYNALATLDPEAKEKGAKLINEINQMYEQFEYKMFTQFGDTIYEGGGNSKEDFDNDDFWFYVNMFKQIEANGGRIKKISDFNGLEGIGDAASDSDWLQSMVQSGRITIDVANLDNKGNVTFKSTAVSSNSALEYTTTTTIDKSRAAKAEAEYEHKMKELDRKDKKFDLDLNKLETERSALKTEYDSVKKVIQDNIERTFGIFS